MPESLSLTDVSKSYRRWGGTDTLVNGVKLTIRDRDCVFLVGPNGSGKSTLLRLACGLLTPDSGAVRVNGLDPAICGRARGQMAALFDNGRSLYPRLSQTENFKYLASLRGFDYHECSADFVKNCSRFGVASYADVVVQKLSRGTQQKVAICCAISVPVTFWVLDEPLLGLDSESVDAFSDALSEHRRRGGASLIATHNYLFAHANGSVIDIRDLCLQPDVLPLDSIPGEVGIDEEDPSPEVVCTPDRG